MTTEEIQAALARVRYKPNTSFRAFEGYDGYKTTTISIQVNTICANTLQPTVIEHGWTVMNDLMYDEPYFLACLFSRIKDGEIHEAREWFTVDGKRVHDPHKGE